MNEWKDGMNGAVILTRQLTVLLLLLLRIPVLIECDLSICCRCCRCCSTILLSLPRLTRRT